jgi:hypothetical protein
MALLVESLHAFPQHVPTLDQRMGMTQVGGEDPTRYEVKSAICRYFLSRSEALNF